MSINFANLNANWKHYKFDASSEALTSSPSLIRWARVSGRLGACEETFRDNLMTWPTTPATAQIFWTLKTTELLLSLSIEKSFHRQNKNFGNCCPHGYFHSLIMCRQLRFQKWPGTLRLAAAFASVFSLKFSETGRLHLTRNL